MRLRDITSTEAGAAVRLVRVYLGLGCPEDAEAENLVLSQCRHCTVDQRAIETTRSQSVDTRKDTGKCPAGADRGEEVRE